MFQLLRSLFAWTILSVVCQTSWAQFTTTLNIPPDVAPSQIESDTQLNLGDGGVTSNGFSAGNPNGSSTNVEMNITGGTVGRDFAARSGSVVNMSGGWMGRSSDAFSGSTFNFSGGTIDEVFGAPLAVM